ncbi:hypothetical protein BDB01DRAFT_895650 [Pilobolus umbonatus]|nr:hypothetical protein BDB01DRAFT_895650 [Pilobolus umbonatus]
MALNRRKDMAANKYQILFSGVALSLTSGLVPYIYTDGNEYRRIKHCTTSEGDTQNMRVVGQATTRSRAINDSKTMELPLLTSTNIYTDNDELSHQKEHCYIDHWRYRTVGARY